MSSDKSPENWRYVPLRAVAEISGGSTPSRSNPAFFGGDIPWATPTDVTGLNDIFIEKTAETLTEQGLRKSSTRLLPPGSVLMTSRATIGFTAIITREMCTNQGFANFICNDRFLFNQYLAYWLPFVRSQLLRMASRTTFQEISKSNLAKLQIPLPPLSEQRRIADIMRQADALRRLRRDADARARDLLPALFQEMFSQSRKDWREKRLGDLLSLEAGRSVAAEAQSAREGEWGILKISAVTSGIFRPDENKKLPDDMQPLAQFEVGDDELLISRANTEELIGASAIARNPPGQLLLPDKLWRVILPQEPETNIYFLYAILNTRNLRRTISIRSTGTSASMKNISQERFLDIKIQLPPKELQDDFERRARVIWDIVIDQQVVASQDIENLFQSLLTRAFNGELTAAWRERNAD